MVRWFTNRHLINESELPLMLQNSVSIQSLAYCLPMSFFFFFSLCTGIFVDFTPSAYLCSAKETAYADARLVVISSMFKCSLAQGVLPANPLQCELLLKHSLIQQRNCQSSTEQATRGCEIKGHSGSGVWWLFTILLKQGLCCSSTAVPKVSRVRKPHLGVLLCI